MAEVVALPPVVVASVVALPPVILTASLGQAGLWEGSGVPDVIIGAGVGDVYLDLLTGTLYKLNPGV